jgi:hypothetical protein
MTKMNLDRAVNSSAWQAIPDVQKVAFIDPNLKASRTAAENLIPGFGEIAEAASRAKAAGKPIRAIR